MGTLTARTEYGVLKTHMHCIKILRSRQRLVFGARCLENEFLEDKITAENCPFFFFFFTECFAVLEKNERDCWFQQAGATAHTAKTTSAFLHYFFCDGFVGRRLCLTRFPDIMPDEFFFLWGFLKETDMNTRIISLG